MSDQLRRRLLELMKQQKTNATRLSLAIGREGSFIHDFLNGKKARVNVDDIDAIEREFGVHPGDLTQLVAGESEAPAKSAGFGPQGAESTAVATREPPVSVAPPRKPVWLAGKDGGETTIEPIADGDFRIRSEMIVTSENLAAVIRFLAEHTG